MKLASTLFLALSVAGCRSAGLPAPELVDFVEMGADMAYFEAFGSGTPVVLLHGGGVDRRVWNEVVGPLAGNHLVIRYDRRGYGESEEPEASFNEVLDLRTLIDSLGLDLVHLVGEDAGGAIAIEFALTYPERVRSLSLLAPNVGGYKFSGRHVAASAAIAKAHMEYGARAAVELWLGRKGLLHTTDVSYLPRKRLAGLLLDNDFVFRAPPRTTRTGGPPAWRRLHQVQAPTLVLVGESEGRDHQMIAAALASKVPEVDVTFVSRAGHMLSLERPDAVSKSLVRFLAAVDRRSPEPASSPDA